MTQIRFGDNPELDAAIKRAIKEGASPETTVALTWKNLWSVLVGTVLCDILQRCHSHGCWKRGRHETIIMGRLCKRHYDAFMAPHPQVTPLGDHVLLTFEK